MSLKRGNGTGCVYKMKHKKLRKPFRAVITVGWTDTGKAIRKTLGTFTNQREAFEALELFEADPIAFEKKDVTFGQCWEWMLEEKRRKGIDMKQAKYGAVANKIPHLMDVPMKNIKTVHLQQVIDDNSHLSYSTLQSIKAGFNGAFIEAVKNDVVNRNYASMVTLPSKTKSNIHKPFQPNDIAILWHNTHIPLVKVMLVYIYTGLRPIELRKILVDDVHINEQYMIGGVKTEAGINRVIPIADCILPILTEFLSLARFKRSPILIHDGYVASRLERPLIQLCNQLCIEAHKPHDGRHTFITMCSANHIPDHIIKTIVGHAHSDVTNDVYVHRTKNQLLDAVNQLPHHDALIKSCATVVLPFQNM